MKLPFTIRIPTVARITIGLIGLLASALMLTSLLGLFPDDRTQTMRRRTVFCESAAAGFSLMAEKAAVETMKDYLATLAKRNPDILSIGVRRNDGSLAVEVGNHSSHWNGAKSDSAKDSQMWVQLYAGDEPWGTFETAFNPVETSNSWLGFGTTGMAHGLAASLLCLVAFYFYLRVVLRHLDPSRVIPRRVREALDTLAEGLVILDKNQRIVLANRAFEDSTGKRQEDLLGSSMDKIDFVNKDETVTNVTPWQEAMENGQSVSGRLLGVESVGDRDCTFYVSASPILDDKGTSRGIMTSFKDVTQLEEKKRELTHMVEYLRKSSKAIKEQNRELERLASRDSLTGCLNRRAFFERFDGQWNVALRYEQPLSVLMIDIDFFKSINDEHGHATGDEVLRLVGSTLQDLARDSDIICRYGGEEFAVLLPMTDEAEAAIVAERVRASVEALSYSSIEVTASVGVATRTVDIFKPEQLLDQADKCLYVAKRRGRNRVVVWEEGLDGGDATSSQHHRVFDEVEPEVVSIPYHAVAALISALAYRDLRTAAHSRRVADLCVAIGEGLLSLTDCYTLEVAALMHDIGKIGVPDGILLKPGPLTGEEWNLMRRHDRIGIEIIRTSFASAKLTAIVGHHRARYVETEAGVVSGKDIPIGARILAIADAFDAMTSEQVFRAARPHEEAFAELRRCAGSQFDPELVERFISTIRSRPDLLQSSGSAEFSKETALVIGLQIEQLSRVLDEHDYDALDAISHRLQATAQTYGVNSISDKASELGNVLDVDRDPHSVLQVANELLDLCRSTQQSLLFPISSDDEFVGLEPIESHWVVN